MDTVGIVGIIGIFGTLSGTILTQVLTSMRERRRLQLEIRRFEIEHPPVPRLESAIFCQIYDMPDAYMAVLSLSIHNIGTVDARLRNIRVRIRGIASDSRPALMQRGVGAIRVEFPIKIAEDNVLPEAYNYLFFESGSKNEITYTTLIQKTITYVLIQSDFLYEQGPSSKIEKIFEVKPLNTRG